VKREEAGKEREEEEKEEGENHFLIILFRQNLPPLEYYKACLNRLNYN
jgi:hypothetical protein